MRSKPSKAFARKVKRAVRSADPGRDMLEDAIQKELVRLLRCAGWGSRDGSVPDRFLHVANERKTSKEHGAHLKAMGVSKGFPDLFFVLSPPAEPGWCGAALEVKTLTGTLRPEQIVWLRTLDTAGYATATEYGLDACVKKLTEWGYL